MVSPSLRLGLVVAICARCWADPSLEFHAFVQKYGRVYNDSEYAVRSSIFEERLKKIHDQNARPDRLWTAGVNHFTDQTDVERGRSFGLVRAGKHGAPTTSQESILKLPAEANGALPKSVHWEKKLNMSSNVPNQGECGSCWAVTSATVLAAHHEIYRGKQRSFSAQQLLNCVANPNQCGGFGGCSGATVELGMAYVLENGLATEKDVPYTGKDDTCTASSFLTAPHTYHHGRAGIAFGMQGWHKLPTNNLVALKSAVAQKGPVAISVGALGWHNYHHGIFDSCGIFNSIINHAVTLFGYGMDGDHKYWQIRNSWGHSWGESGFIRLKMLDDEENSCHWDVLPQLGTGCTGGPLVINMCGACGLLSDSIVPHFGGSDDGSGRKASFVRREHSDA